MLSSYKAPSILEVENNILNHIPDDYVKDVGTFTRDLTKAFAINSQELEKKIEILFEKLDANNYFGEELERFVFQKKGLHRKQAKASKGELEVKGNGVISIGDIFETDSGTRFKALERKEIIGAGKIRIEAIIAGESGNVGANTIRLIPITIQGIISVNNPQPTYDGYNAETDDSLRERYFIEIQKPATSGNIYHYMQWAREVVGVGDSKIFPLWQGNNTVQIVIIDDNKLAANQELVERVQNYIDPKGENNISWGTGAGQAPIGAYCTVSSATSKKININCTLILKHGYTLEPLKPLIKAEIKKYLKNIAFQRNSVSYAVLSSWILQVEGVQEWTAFTINGGHENISIGEKEIAELGDVSINVL